MKAVKMLATYSLSFLLALLSSSSWGALIYVGNNAAAVGITNQHPIARGEQRYDTNPATGIYNRQVDLLNQRYDTYADYLQFTNGDWYCTPTSALSLVHYWATFDGPDANNLPDYPNLFNPGIGDTDRSVTLAIASLMDTDDWAVYGGNDPNELHLGTRRVDLLSGLMSFFSARYPNAFMGGEFSVAAAGGGAAGNAAFGNLYDQLIQANVPLILSFPGHSTVGIGFDNTINANNPAHYRVNDPWNAAANIPGQQVGLGRPNLGDAVFGGLATDLYGQGAESYQEYPSNSQTASPVYMAWVHPVPEPGTLYLLAVGFMLLASCNIRYKREK